MLQLLKILKINALALIALPILLLATMCKLVSKALDKIGIILSMFVVTATLFLLFRVIRAPQTTLQIIFCAILFVFVAFTMLLMIQLLLTFSPKVFQYVIKFLDGIYDLIYVKYLKLYETCRKDYDTVSSQGEKRIFLLACLFYSLLYGIRKLLVGFISYSLYIGILACIVLVIGSLASMNHTVQTALGLNLINYLGKFDGFSLLHGILIYLAVMGTLCVILISLGIEWQKWSKELQMNSSEYTKADVHKKIAKANSSIFFTGCDTLEKLEKRYKSLCKAYHPDSVGGDEESFKALQAEYERVKSTML